MTPEAEAAWTNIKTTLQENMTAQRRTLILRMMEALMPDNNQTGTLACGLATAPAAKANHHAGEGGLLCHTNEMMTFHHALKKILTDNPRLGGHWGPNTDLMTEDRILTGIIIHDLSKAYLTFTRDPENPGKFIYLNDATFYLTANQKTMHLLAHHGIVLDQWEQNALEHSEGGWAENPPKGGTVLGKYLYILDELSGNVYDRLRKRLTLFGEKGTPQPFRAV